MLKTLCRPALVLLAALALAGCATAPTAGAHPAPENIGEQMMWELDEGGEPTVELTPPMKGVVPNGLKAMGSDLRRDHGRLLSVTTAAHDESPTWESDELSATFEKNPLPMLISAAFDGSHHLAGIFFDDGAGRLPLSELGDAVRTFPGDWSATAILAEHPEVSFHYRSDVAQGMASQFKVLILAKVCDEISHGRMKEDTRMELPNAVRGVPSCTLCNFQAGLRPTLHDVVHLMISTSDNTATDWLISVLGWKNITDYARQSAGVEHPPAMLTTQGLFSLECSAGPLKKIPPEQRSAWLAELSMADRVKAGEEAATDAFQEGPEGYGTHCWQGDGPPNLGKDISHVADWPIRTGELAEMYNRAQLGKLGDGPTSGCFIKYMEEAGGGGVNTNDHIHKLGNKNGMESDIHSLGVVADTDRGHIALSISVTGIPDGKSDEAYSDMIALARSLVNNVWAEAPH